MKNYREFVVAAAADGYFDVDIPKETRLIFINKFVGFILRVDDKLVLNVGEPAAFDPFSKSLLRGRFDDYLGLIVPVNEFSDAGRHVMTVSLALKKHQVVTIITVEIEGG